MQALLAVPLAKARHPRRVDGHHKPASEQAILVQDLLLQQRLHQGVFELFQLGFGQPAQHLVDRVQMRQPQLEQALVLGPEFRLGPLVIEGVARTLPKHEEQDPRQQNFRQRIVGFLPTVFQLAQRVEQIGKKMRDRLAQFAQDRLPAAGARGGGAPPGAAPGLTFGRVARLPLLAAVQEGDGSVARQGLRNSREKIPWKLIPQHRRVNLPAPQTAGKIFFQYQLTKLNLNIFYRRSESLPSGQAGL